MLKRLNRWFELNWGWFFINGKKQAEWTDYLRKKYENIIKGTYNRTEKYHKKPSNRKKTLKNYL